MVVIIKPTYACNFRCKYCYLSNDTKSSHRVFDAEFAKSFILQIKDYMQNTRRRRLTVIWHGGEPLLWGIENYREIFAFMESELAEIELKNSLQTNLSLITEAYIDLFLHYDVHVGFSLDGIKEIHDSQRIDVNGEGTFDTTMQKVALCREKGLNMGCIVVGSRKHIGRISELYEFMSKDRLNFKFNPLFRAGEAQHNKDDYAVSAEEYAEMAIELFDLWYFDKQHRIKESNFEEIASNLLTGKVSGCLFGQNCQDNFCAISPNGDVMPCGRFCDTQLRGYAYGNLYEEKLADIMQRKKSAEAYKRAEYIENSSCKHCKFFAVCHGGCLHDGFLRSGDFTSKTFLCAAYKKIFSHINSRIQSITKL